MPIHQVKHAFSTKVAVIKLSLNTKEVTPTWSAVKNFKWLICAQLSICWTLMYTAITPRLEYP